MPAFLQPARSGKGQLAAVPESLREDDLRHAQMIAECFILCRRDIIRNADRDRIAPVLQNDRFPVDRKAGIHAADDLLHPERQRILCRISALLKSRKDIVLPVQYDCIRLRTAGKCTALQNRTGIERNRFQSGTVRKGMIPDRSILQPDFREAVAAFKCPFTDHPDR